MTSANPSSTSKDAQTSPPAAASASASTSVDQLPALHEDDEFEEFASQDWDDSATYSNVLASKSAQASTGGAAAAAAGTDGQQQQQQKQGLDSLWQDNWDDDDVEDDFSVALRYV
ncbi:BQ2448_7381 [Microbotryum intermedium]|uniref:26S proteasome complex subunit SEM1 n=1 Tax=Microbotryum intermedium TaxID=269621 RepID=A0A238FJX9_9BASI|nr:BQ2448_7381 [Microbotryum intermedium]